MTSQGRREKSGLFGSGFKVLEKIEQRLLFLFRIFANNKN